MHGKTLHCTKIFTYGLSKIQTDDETSAKTKKIHKKNFAEQNYSYVNQPQTTHPPPNNYAKPFIFTKIEFPTKIIKFSTFS